MRLSRIMGIMSGKIQLQNHLPILIVTTLTELFSVQREILWRTKRWRKKASAPHLVVRGSSASSMLHESTGYGDLDLNFVTTCMQKALWIEECERDSDSYVIHCYENISGKKTQETWNLSVNAILSELLQIRSRSFLAYQYNICDRSINPRPCV